MNAYITKISKFLPGDPVENEQMENYLGKIGNTPSKARRIILAKNGIKRRYYAIGNDGKLTYTNHAMAAKAVKGLFDDKIGAKDIDLLSCGTGSPEQIIPSHGVMVHGELPESKNIEVVSFAGSCCTGMDALKYASLSVETGQSKNAAVTASERVSAWIRAPYFEKEGEYLSQLEKQPMLAFQKEFLRWMLSDGAYALLVQPHPNKETLSLRIDWIEICSFASKYKTCMYAGGELDEMGELKGWSQFSEQEWLTKSLFAIKQDTRMLGENIVKLGIEFLLELGEKYNFKPDDIDWFLPHLSSMYFKDIILQECQKCNFYFPEDKWFINLPYIGNIASASGFAMLEELLYSGRLKKGEKILLMIPESARFSYCYCMLTVC